MHALSRLLFIAVAMLLAGCNTGSVEFYADQPSQRVLPDKTVLLAESEDGEKQAWSFEWTGSAYRWTVDDESSLVSLFPVTAAGVRPGTYIVKTVADDDGEILYALAQAEAGSVKVFVFDAAKFAVAMGVPATSKSFSTIFDAQADLEKVFAGVAARLPADAKSKFKLDETEIAVAPMQVFDLSDPAQKKLGDEALEKYAEKKK